MHPDLKLTPHAQRRRKQMGVTEDQIERAVREPETVYPGLERGRISFQRGRIVVITDSTRTRVITVMWHGEEGR